MEYKQVRFSVEMDSTDNVQPILQTYDNEPDNHRELKARLDKWLWAARFYKTRALARSAIESGMVLYNGQTTTPGREIEIGSSVEIVSSKLRKHIIIKELSTRRHNTDEAHALFEEAPITSQAKPKRTTRYLRREHACLEK